MDKTRTCPRCGGEYRVGIVELPTAEICPLCLYRFVLDEAAEATVVRSDDPIPEVPDPHSKPKHLKNYEILGMLGAGGMGTVWKAKQRGLDRYVAIKLLANKVDPDEVERFFREARAAAKLRHPHIVPIHEVSSEAGWYFYAMDFVDGETLEQATKGSRIVPRDGVGALAKISRAVHFAHENDVIHRDIKPANILLDSQGVPSIADFGLAKDVSSQAGLTQSGEILGTPSYMAPEQAGARREDIGRATDVYALGATLYFVLTGKPPHTGNDVYDVIRRVVEEDPKPPRELVPGIDRDLEAVVLKCLEKDPARRYPTAQGVAEDLERWLKGDRVQASHPGPLYRLRKRIYKVRVILSVAAAGILASIVIAALANMEPSPGPEPELPDVLENEKKAVEGLRSVSEAQEKLKTRDLDGNGVKDYWTADVVGLSILKSADGEALDLIDPRVAAADISPLGTVAAAGRYTRPEKSPDRSPPGGYYYRSMVSDSSGGETTEYAQDTGGSPNMGAVHHPSRFGFCAFPSQYERTGWKTFIVNERGIVYWRDTRGSPVLVWPSARELATSWTRAQ